MAGINSFIIVQNDISTEINNKLIFINRYFSEAP